MKLKVNLPFECSLHPWCMGDLPGLIRAGSDPRIGRHMADAFPCPYSLASGRDFIEKAMADRPTCAFAIRVEDVVAGAIAVQSGKDIHRLGAELGYWLNPYHWNRGIATACVGTITGYAFRTWDIGFVYAKVFSSNPASAKVLERNGYSIEGIWKASIIKDGVVDDELTLVRRRVPSDAMWDGAAWMGPRGC